MKTSTKTRFEGNFRVKFLFLAYFLGISLGIFGQSITLPGSDGAVFQRKGVGQGAELEIGINFNDSGLSSVQVYVEKYNDNSSSTTVFKNWENYTCDPYPNVGGNYKRVILNLPDGMFNVKVRRSDNQLSTGFRRLGVGEVFYVAGQSNTTGLETVSVPSNPNPALASWVNFENSKNGNIVNLNSSKVQASCPSNPDYGVSFRAGFDGSDPGSGYVSHWYRLAERLVFTLKVPVAIFQAGWSGSSVREWSDAANDTKVCRFYQNSVSDITTYPYYNLRSLFSERKFNGVRAVLWHQGEYDAVPGINMTKADYKSYLSNLIQKSRTHSQSAMGVTINLPWVIAQASKSNGVSSNSNITTAQSEVAQQSYNWIGPDSDGINDREDGTHFNQNGLSTLADRWYDKLVGGIINSSVPIPAFGRTGTSCTTPTPSITVNGSTTLCNGSTVNLTVTGCSGAVNWSNGSTSNSITVSAAGSYWVKCTNTGCTQSNQSSSIGVAVCNPPVSSCYRFYIAGFHSSNDFRPITLSGNILNLPSNGDNTNNSIWKKVQDGAYSKLVSVTNENTAITIENGAAGYDAVVNVANYTGAGSQKWSIEQSSGQPYYFIKSSLNTGFFIGGGNGAWDGGDTDMGTKDLKLKSDAGWGGNKWYMESVTCPTTCSSPTLTISANGSTSLCGGGLVSLSTSGCSGGTINWSNGGTGTGTSVSAAGSYTATCTLPGCTPGGPSNSITVTNCNPSPCYRLYIAGYHSSNDFRPITLTGSVLNIPSNGDNTNNSIWKIVQDGAYSKLVSVTNENTAITIENGVASFDAVVNVASYTGAGSQKWSIEQSPGQSYYFIKSSLNTGLFIGGGNGAWDGGDADSNTKDLKLKNDTGWGGNKWFMQSVTCPNGRISAEYVGDNAEEVATKTVVSPNPTEGIVKVKYYLAKQAKVFFSLTDNLGKAVYAKQIESKAGENYAEFDLKNSPAGVYYLNLRSVQKTETVKVVKMN